MGLTNIIRRLCGQPAPFGDTEHEFPEDGLGYSQLNEILLDFGLDRVETSFFAYLHSGTVEYKSGMSFDSEQQFVEAVDIFERFAVLKNGNVKYAFKTMSKMADYDLEFELEYVAPIDESEYTSRHSPIREIEPIDVDSTYLLGYLIDAEIRKRQEEEPSNPEVEALVMKRDAVQEIGDRNHRAYLSSDHMDVYVATSMRAPHQFAAVNKTIRQVFAEDCLAELKPRYFDPTQARCPDRIDKGLSEALMLKRAKGTLYLVQETDTLGKDSELASTLAQGKPVIAYVPKLDEDGAKKEIEELVDFMTAVYPTRSIKQILLDHIRDVDPRIAWTDPGLRRAIDSEDTNEAELESLRSTAELLLRSVYDKRAKMLEEQHPLAIQVNLATGVACGVLVARTPQVCAELIRRIMTNTLDFTIEHIEIAGGSQIRLREKITGSIFRVVSGDSYLTNAFWNFYRDG